MTNLSPAVVAMAFLVGSLSAIRHRYAPTRRGARRAACAGIDLIGTVAVPPCRYITRRKKLARTTYVQRTHTTERTLSRRRIILFRLDEFHSRRNSVERPKKSMPSHCANCVRVYYAALKTRLRSGGRSLTSHDHHYPLVSLSLAVF